MLWKECNRPLLLGLGCGLVQSYGRHIDYPGSNLQELPGSTRTFETMNRRPMH